MQEYQGQVKEVKFLTLTTLEVNIELLDPSEMKFEAGQYVEFKVGNLWKPYSISSVPDHNKFLKFCVALFNPPGPGSIFFKNLKVGDKVTLKGPLGSFIVKNFERNAFFVAAGVGIAPFVSIIPDILSRGFHMQAKLLFGIRHEEDVFYFDRFGHVSALYPNFKFIPTLSQPLSHWPGETGRVTTYLETSYENFQDYMFYICGGAGMVKDTRSVLLKRGHKPEDIKLEIFV